MNPAAFQREIWSSPMGFLGTLTKVVQRKVTKELTQLFTGLQKGVEQIPPLVSKGVVHIQNKAEEKLPPEVRRQVIPRLWRISPEEIGKHKQKVELHITELRKEAPEHLITYRTHEVEPGRAIEGVELFHPDYSEHVVYFGGITYLWQRSFATIWQLHKALRVNVSSFNYRGTVDPHGFDPSEEGWLEDGIKHVEELLAKGIPAEKISVWGRSLGGGVAMKVAASLTGKGIEVAVVNERSFRCLKLASARLVPKGDFASEKLGYSLNSEDEMLKLKKRLIIIVHERDEVIPLPVSMHAAAFEKQPTNVAIETIFMKDGAPPLLEQNEALPAFAETHCRGFTQEELDRISAVFHSKERSAL